MKKNDARVKVTIRLHKDTLKDLDLLAKKLESIYDRPTRSTAIRYILRTGFSNIGNWRSKDYRF